MASGVNLIRDAIHGNIELQDDDLRILDSPEMQRLRFVRQLSAAYLVYPSATHTRFEHCLGAYHLTRMLAKNVGLPGDEAKLAVWSALMHDIGHGAFSHASDPVLVENGLQGHEARGIEVMKKSAISDEINAAGFSVNDVRKRMAGGHSGKLVGWDLGTDRIDYLLRDAHFTGAQYSLVDAERVLNTTVFRDGKILVLEKGRVSAESLLVSRYFMFTAVYYHPAARICEGMVQGMLREALRAKTFTPQEIAAGGDSPVLFRLADEGSELAKRLLERRLFKKAFVLDVDKAPEEVQAFLSKPGAWKHVWKALGDAGFSQEEAAVVPPALLSKPVTAHIVSKEGKEYSLAEESGVIRALNEGRNRAEFIVACDAELRHKAQTAVKQLLDCA